RRHTRSKRDWSSDVCSSDLVVCIIGPSGSGKSTLLRCLNRLEEIQGGTIVVNGKKISEAKDIDNIRQTIGMVFQHFNLFPHLSVKENITLAPVKLGKLSKAEADGRAKKLLDRKSTRLNSSHVSISYA